MKTWQGDACIVAVARLVSLWRDTCSYNGGGPVHRAQDFNGFTGPISRAISVTTGSPKLLLRMCLCGYFFGRSSIAASDTGRGCQSRQEDGQSAVLLFAYVTGHP